MKPGPGRPGAAGGGARSRALLRGEDEAELGIFCYELVEVVFELWPETKIPMEETGRRLLDAWERDGHLRLAFVPEELAGRRLRKKDREWLVQELGRRRKGTGDRYQRRLLTKALARMR